jgi:hypothetical protein
MVSNRTYNIKICKIYDKFDNFFITGCYNVKITTHLKRLLKFYNNWKNDLTNRKSYQIIFGFFEKYGTDCEIKLYCEYIGTNKSKEEVIEYLLSNLKDYKNCFNNYNNIYKKYKCWYLDL